MKKSHKGKHRKSKSKVNGHIILLAAILVLAATAIIKLIIWNIGTKSDYDPDNIAEGYDVEALDTIIPLSESKLEGHVDDGVTTILCLGNNPLTDETGSNGFISQIGRASCRERVFSAV